MTLLLPMSMRQSSMSPFSSRFRALGRVMSLRHAYCWNADGETHKQQVFIPVCQETDLNAKTFRWDILQKINESIKTNAYRECTCKTELAPSKMTQRRSNEEKKI